MPNRNVWFINETPSIKGVILTALPNRRWLVITTNGDIRTPHSEDLELLINKNDTRPSINRITFDHPTREHDATATRHAEWRGRLVCRGIVKQPPGMEPGIEYIQPRPRPY
jgi:hypothetical protein